MVGWQLDLLEATSDMEVTQEEVTGMMSEAINATAQGMVLLGMMTMVVKGFYGMLGSKRHTKQREEVLGLVKEIW